mgnify:CR=1 FL=1
MRFVQTDFLILGSGIAGLIYAIKVAEKFPGKTVHIVTKSNSSESNTKYAQGGIAAVLDLEDSFESHIKDTCRAGGNLNNKAIVELVVRSAPDVLKELIQWGANFDLDVKGELDLAKEGGHEKNRIVHFKDITGAEIERALLEKVYSLPTIQLLPHHYAVDLITEHQVKGAEKNICYGAYVLDEVSNSITTYRAHNVLLATGGIGQVYKHTTNPLIATGDGIAMAYRAKTPVTHMEFIQFHPTSLYELDVSPSFLISEAVRGFGAYLVNHSGERFMQKYDERMELASRDIVSRAIDTELKISGEKHVFLDCRHLDKSKFTAHFPNIYNKCLTIGIDPIQDKIPVVPAAHYLCGGIQVDSFGNTALKNLLACGECADTGLHGANRLASNSLLEAMVMGSRLAENVYLEDNENTPSFIPFWNEAGTIPPEERIIITNNREEVQSIMSNLVAIVRSNKRLRSAKTRLDLLFWETDQLYRNTIISRELCELRNLICIALMIVEQSLNRKENVGAFFNKDFNQIVSATTQNV